MKELCLYILLKEDSLNNWVLVYVGAYLSFYNVTYNVVVCDIQLFSVIKTNKKPFFVKRYAHRFLFHN